MKTLKCLLSFILLLVAANAQEEVELLSAFEISSNDAGYLIKPPITLTKRADFLLLELSLVNDSRMPDQRRAEIYATIKAMFVSIPMHSKIVLFTPEFDLSSDHYQVPLNEDSNKRDTSTVTLFAKVPLSDADDAGVLIETLNKFASSLKVVGRTEIFRGNLGLSIINPQKYRYEYLEVVAEDRERLQGIFGNSFVIAVSGLEKRIEWKRSSISEIELYMRFRYEVLPANTATLIQ